MSDKNKSCPSNCDKTNTSSEQNTQKEKDKKKHKNQREEQMRFTNRTPQANFEF